MTKPPGKRSILASFNAFEPNVADEARPAALAVQPPPLPAPRLGAGVIGATARSLNDLNEERERLKALVAAGGGLELDPQLIDPSPFPDRLPDDDDLAFKALKKLIDEEGQKVPIQVRRHPTNSDRYQVVYGSRRCRAARELGIKVKAILTELSDAELVVSQGIENSARQDLSWIEKALFAWRMETQGIKARDIRAALAVDDTELAHYRAVTRALPVDTIEAIGRAPKAGRPRWRELARLITADEGALSKVDKTFADAKVLSSDQRFRNALAVLKRSSNRDRPDVDLHDGAGRVVGRASFESKSIKLSIDESKAEEFAEFLREELPALMARFSERDERG